MTGLATDGRLQRRRGVALVAALAMLVLIAVAALEASVAAAGRRRAAANALERAEGEAVARAGLAEARARLLGVLRLGAGPGADPATRADPWARMAGVRLGPRPIGALRYEVTMRDAGAALHLNRATEEQLRLLLLALDIDAARADRVAQAILDWRDGDALRRPRGAERAEYLRAGRPVLPDDAPFGRVDALRDVAGVDAPLLEMLRPHLTVVGRGRVNLNAAPAAVLAAVPGMSPESIALLLRRRRDGRPFAALGELAQALSPAARERLLGAMPALIAQSTTTTDELEVTSIARDADGVVRARIDALVLRENGPRVAWARTTP